MVYTPRWFPDPFAKDDVVMGRHYLVIFEYDYERLINRINTYLELCSGETWQDVARKVARIGLWEFEDYKG